jgi:hypothetical protein
MPRAIASWNRRVACDNFAGSRGPLCRWHRWRSQLQCFYLRKQRRALRGRNHAEGYSGGAHRADAHGAGVDPALWPAAKAESDD